MTAPSVTPRHALSPPPLYKRARWGAGQPVGDFRGRRCGRGGLGEPRSVSEGVRAGCAYSEDLPSFGGSFLPPLSGLNPVCRNEAGLPRPLLPGLRLLLRGGGGRPPGRGVGLQEKVAPSPARGDLRRGPRATCAPPSPGGERPAQPPRGGRGPHPSEAPRPQHLLPHALARRLQDADVLGGEAGGPALPSQQQGKGSQCPP